MLKNDGNVTKEEEHDMEFEFNNQNAIFKLD